ncbi:MAG: hypothetical protein R3C03_02170 [Pirellulaceae bacterium]
MPVKLIDSDGNVIRPDLGSTDPLDAFVSEIQQVRDAVKSGSNSELLSGELAMDALRICDAQSRSVQSGQLECV